MCLLGAGGPPGPGALRVDAREQSLDLGLAPGLCSRTPAPGGGAARARGQWAWGDLRPSPPTQAPSLLRVPIPFPSPSPDSHPWPPASGRHRATHPGAATRGIHSGGRWKLNCRSAWAGGWPCGGRRALEPRALRHPLVLCRPLPAAARARRSTHCATDGRGETAGRRARARGSGGVAPREAGPPRDGARRGGARETPRPTLRWARHLLRTRAEKQGLGSGDVHACLRVRHAHERARWR